MMLSLGACANERPARDESRDPIVADQPAATPARCTGYQAMLGVDRRHVVHHSTMVYAPTAQLIPAEDEVLVRRAVELWTGSPPRQPAGDARRVYVAAGPDQPVAALAAWKATLPEGVEARLIVKLDTSEMMRRFRAAHPDLPPDLEERLHRLSRPEQLMIPLVDAVGHCDQARAGLALLKNGDADAAGKATAAGLAACECRLADLDAFVYLAAWLLEPGVGWFPLTDDLLAAANGEQVGQMVSEASR